jgi:hypothetical protein
MWAVRGLGGALVEEIAVQFGISPEFAKVRPDFPTIFPEIQTKILRLVLCGVVPVAEFLQGPSS